MSGQKLEVTKLNLEELFFIKHDRENMGWSPRLRLKYGYFTPDDFYEALTHKLVNQDTHWLDVGGGRDIFPSNKTLADTLSKKCARLVGVDPSPNILENKFAHERVQCLVENYTTSDQFDIATLRMVAEHINTPELAVNSLARLVKRGGKVVVYTINRWSPIPLLTLATPFKYHHLIKHCFWNTGEKDTFPVAYKLNTRSALRNHFEKGGFKECFFTRLSDCRTLAKWKFTTHLELTIWRILGFFRLPYPEYCLLGVYERI